MKILKQDIHSLQEIQQDKSLNKLYKKRGKIDLCRGFCKVEVIKVGESYTMVEFSLSDIITNFFRCLLNSNKKVHFNTLLLHKLGEKRTFSWVKKIEDKSTTEKTNSTGQKQLTQRKEAPPPPKTPNLTQTTPPKKKEKAPTKETIFNPAGSRETKAFEQRRAEFAKVALGVKGPFTPSTQSLALRDAQKKTISEFIKDYRQEGQFASYKPPKGVSFYSSLRVVFTIDSIPGLIFKIPNLFHVNERAKAEEKKACQAVTKAKKICEKDNLYSLHIPETAVIDLVDDEWCTVQEKCEVSGSHEVQKGLYQYIQGEKELEGYRKTLFKHLATLIVKLGFTDAKLNNMPVSTKTGKIILYDLDATGSFGGLFSSGRYKGGLLNLPIEEDAELQLHVETLVQEKLGEKSDELRLGLEKAKKKYNGRKEKIAAYQAFAEKNDLHNPKQRFCTNTAKLTKIFPDEAQRELAKTFLQYLNTKLDERQEAGQHFDLRRSRKIKINTQYGEDGTNQGMKKRESIVEFQKRRKEILPILKQHGYIHAWKQKSRDYDLKIYC